MLQRIEHLEQRVTDLEAGMAYQDARNRIRERFPSAPSSASDDSPAGGQARPGYTGARVVARHMLQAGRSAEDVAAHLEATFDLRDAAAVVAEVAYYDSGLSEPKREGT